MHPDFENADVRRPVGFMLEVFPLGEIGIACRKLYLLLNALSARRCDSFMCIVHLVSQQPYG